MMESKGLTKSGVRKRSVIVLGKKTSVSLEDEFWDAAKEIADTKGMPLFKYIDALVAERTTGNLSSLIRTTVLDHFVRQARGRP